MSIVKPENLFKHAIENSYALPAFNVFSTDSLIATLEGLNNQQSPGIIQVSIGARKHFKHLNSFVKTIRDFSGNYSIPVFIQHDHCSTYEDCVIAIECGVQAVMFDGSHLPFEKNIEMTREVVEYAKNRQIWVEAELGVIPGSEDDIVHQQVLYTDPDLVNTFIEQTGCNALAISVGTSHGGIIADDYLPLNKDLLLKIIKSRPDYPFVLHGAASLPPELIELCNKQGGKVKYLRNCSEQDICTATKLGVKKINMDVDNFLTFTTAVRKYLNANPQIYDPRKYIKEGMLAWQKEVEHKIKKVSLSSGMV
ncbi:MAG: class II fructose-bisphosphate aldolase [Saccharofermentanales bacterium]